jgi:hypothetical protein
MMPPVMLLQWQEWPEQQDALSGDEAVGVTYCAGAASNFDSQPREQKWYVFPS